jgi:hypothetical protein
MIEILNLSDLAKITHYPRAVVETIRQSIINLDTAYGTDRTRDGDGGLELIVESEEELQSLIQTLPYGDTPECSEVIHRGYIRAVYVINNNRTIDVSLPRAWATQNMLEVLEA